MRKPSVTNKVTTNHNWKCLAYDEQRLGLGSVVEYCYIPSPYNYNNYPGAAAG